MRIIQMKKRRYLWMTFLSDKSIIITDSSSRNVKILYSDGIIGVISGCDSRDQKFGTGERSTFKQKFIIREDVRTSLTQLMQPFVS